MVSVKERKKRMGYRLVFEGGKLCSMCRYRFRLGPSHYCDKGLFRVSYNGTCRHFEKKKGGQRHE